MEIDDIISKIREVKETNSFIDLNNNNKEIVKYYYRYDHYHFNR